MTPRTLRLTAVLSLTTLVLAAMLSCSTSSDSPGDPAGPPGPGGGGGAVLRTPDIVTVTPSQTCATAGNVVTVEGFDLVDGSFLATVTINGVNAPVVDRFEGGAGTDVLVVQTPAMAVPGTGLQANVQVTTPYGTTTAVGAVRVLPACDGVPIVVSAEPAQGARAGFEAVTLTGDNLACLQSVQFVSTSSSTVLNASILSVLSDQSIIILTPTTSDPTTAPYQIVVTSACGSNVAPRPTFQYTGSGPGGGPTLPDATAIVNTSTGLAQGPSVGGNTVRITGRDLNLVTSIAIGPTTLTLAANDFIITANGDILIMAMPSSPAGASLTVPVAVTVTGSAGADPTPVTYTYVGAGSPSCVSLTPNSGSVVGGTAVRINGANLNDVDRVLFGGIPAADIAYPTSDGSALVATAPPYPLAIDVDIELQVTGGAGFTTIGSCRPARFTYVSDTSTPPFSVVSINPPSGPQTGGTTIVITGTGLDSVTSVRICDVPATITSALSEQVQATTGLFNGTVPATCDVVVTAAGGLQATLEAGFTYRPVVPDAQSFAADSSRTAPQAGGTFFRLQGTNLIGVTAVGFGGSQSPNRALACELDIQSNTQVAGTAPAFLTPGAAFPSSVSVVAESGAGVDSTPLTFTYYANPTIADARGPLGDDRIQANELVTVVGNNFRPQSDVFVGEIEIRNSGETGNGAAGSARAILGPGAFTVISNGLLEFNFPASLRVQDSYDVVIRTPRQGAECVATYEHVATRTLFLGTRPSAAVVQPPFGRWTGGTTVEIRGNFALPVTRVTICGVDQTVVAGSQTATTVQITTRSTGSEAAAGVPCDVVVFNDSGASDPILAAYTFVREPDLASVEGVTPGCGLRSSTVPAQVPVPVTAGEVLTLRGGDFGTSLAGVNTVLIGGVPAVLGANRGPGFLEVFVPTAPAGGPRFNVAAQIVFPAAPGATADTTYTSQLPVVVAYQDPPGTVSIAPAVGNAGSQAVISGTNLRNVEGTATTVLFDGVPATVVSNTGTAVTVIVPAGTLRTRATVDVGTCMGTSSTTFFYCAQPTILASGGVSPASGQTNTTVTITGSNLLGVDDALPTVTFGTTSALVTGFTDLGGGNVSITVLAPGGIAAGTSVPVSVTACRGTITAAELFSYTGTTPTTFEVTGLAPIAGPRDGGQRVVISGNGLQAVNLVTFCGVSATIESASASQVIVTTRAYNGPAPTLCEVRVSDPTGNQDALASAYTYLALLPDATAFEVTPGGAQTAPQAGGTSFALSGNNLLDVNLAQFGGSVNDPAACNLQAPNNTRVTGVAPDYTTVGGPFPRDVEIYVSSSAGRDETPVVGFTYYENPRLSNARAFDPFLTPRPFGIAHPGDTVVLNGTAFRPELWSHVGGIATTGGTITGDLPFAIGAVNDGGGANTITTVVPSGMKQGDVMSFTIRTPSGPTCTATYTFTLVGALRIPELNCADATDNDADGGIDCADPDCAGVPPCP